MKLPVFKLEKYFVSPYFWWESLAFIGPIFILGIAFTLHLRKKITSNYLYLLLLISTVLFMFSILDNKLNPFYWLFYYVPFIKQFRIPSRVFIYLIPVLMLFGALGLNYIYKKSRRKVIKAAIILVLILNLILTTYVFKNYIYNKSLPRVNPESSFILTFLKKYDSSYFYIAQNSLFQNQLLLYESVENKQMILNSMYGWKIGSGFLGNYLDVDFYRRGKYSGIYPKYFIYPKDILPPKDFEVKSIKEVNGMVMYKNSVYSPFAYLTKNIQQIKTSSSDDPNIKSINITPNKIKIIASSPSPDQHLLLLVNYFPGWSATIDGVKTQFIKNDLLTVATKQGSHLYTFEFTSMHSMIGFLVTIISISIWFLVTKNDFFILVKKYRSK